MGKSDALHVTVVYAEPDSVWQRCLEVVAGTTVAEAIARSGFDATHAKVAGQAYAVGIYGHRVNAGQAVRDGDRVEIYRPLCRDPMTARRQRAAKD